jgi:hypothetical protein
MSQKSFDDQDEGEEHQDEKHENGENDEKEYQDQDQDELSTCRFLTYSVVGIIVAVVSMSSLNGIMI